MSKNRYLLPLIALSAAILFILLWTGASTPAEVQQPVPKPEKILTGTDSMLLRFDTLLTARIDSSQLVGGALVITIGDSVVYQRCFGVREAGGKEPVDSHTIFRLASVSKTMTGTLAGILSEEGLVGLNDRVIDYMPGFRLKDSVNTRLLTVGHILSHTSGLVPHAYDNLVEAHLPMRTIIDSLQRVNIAGLPGQYYGYQNVVFSLYDTLASIKTGESFDRLLHDKLFAPFGMSDASAGFAAFMSSPDRAMPHGRKHGGYRTLKVNDRYYNTLPAAGINASISDMGQFLLMLNGKDPNVFSTAMADSIFRPRIKTALKWSYLRHWDKVESKAYGLGWRIIGYHGEKIAYHGGYVEGYHAEIALCREKQIGIAWLTNSPGSVGAEAVPLFLDLYFNDLANRSFQKDMQSSR